MKQISQNYKTGNIRLEEVTPPALRSGGILVRTHYSVVSSGTEGMKVREGKLSYLGKARARPDQLKKLFASARQQGLRSAYHKAMNKLEALSPLGYSLAGEVVATGEGAEEFHVGQRVACAGAGYANHAEINFVPTNLAVAIPQSVSMKHAAFTTVGAVALQGFRQAEARLGETACVIGLGLLGQLLLQILRAGGIQVIGIDIAGERCELAKRLGAKVAITPDDPALDAAVRRLTAGHGVDCVFIAAGGAGNQPVELAAALARDRARIVDIGKTRLDLPWNDYYLKELEVKFSRSYGPGRYDPVYEEYGIDYPIGYVRWTEKRNMAAFLELIAEGKVGLDAITSSVRPFSEAEQVYEHMADRRGVLATVLDYTAGPETPTERLISVPYDRAARRSADGCARVGVIGAGSYASSMLLPHLRRNGAAELRAVATSSSLSAENARRKFGFHYATTRYAEILADDQIDAVIIATRHSSHADLVCQALRAGKAVYVEKPLALTTGELKSIRRAIEESGNSRLMVGFNRRFSPMLDAVAEQFRKLFVPLVMQYRVHAGQLEQGSWYLDMTQGSRFVGEAGHFFDVLAYLVRARPVSVFASCLRPDRPTRDDLENVVAVVDYDDGSTASISYLTQGGTRLPKENLEVFGGGCTARLENFESLVLFERNTVCRVKPRRVDKGQEAEMAAFIDSVKSGSAMPIPLESLFDTTLATLAVPASLRAGAPVSLGTLWSEL